MTVNPPSDSQAANKPRLALPSVTLCAVSSSNLRATVLAMETSLAQIEFADALLFTDRSPADLGIDASSPIRIVPISSIRSAESYSRFILSELADHISTDHALIVQWDGHVIDAARWQDTFLDFDYIGASWPQFDDGYDVGNGGFSLRSRRLMEACLRQDFQSHHPEDLAIGRTNRALLEELGLKFAPKELADQFSAERSGDPAKTFGYHGVFLMPETLGTEKFWSVYKALSDRTTLWSDFGILLRAMLKGTGGIARVITLLRDRLEARP